MTVTYSLHVSTTNFAGFAKLLVKWRGGIYRLIYRELLLFTIVYYALAMIYRYGLSETQMHTFEKIALYCRNFSDFIPLTFVLGFYVSLIVGRWWEQYMNLPWVDKTCYKISALVHGADEQGRLIRRTLARYLSLMAVFCLRSVSTVVNQRFPSFENIVEAGLMTESEARELENTKIMKCRVGETGCTEYSKWAVPSIWFINILTKARKEGRIDSDLNYRIILDEMLNFRGGCGMLWSYDWISVPLVYTQVVTVAVCTFVISSLMGRQYLYIDHQDEEGSFVDKYFPLLTFFQFFFYVGWLKVAEELINPLGSDDNDFELNYLVDRNLEMSFFIVDDMHAKIPPMEHDMFWKDPTMELPYTPATVHTRLNPWMGSAMESNTNKHVDWAKDDESDVDSIYGNPANLIRRLTSPRHPRMRKISRARSQSSMHYGVAIRRFPTYLARKLSNQNQNKISPRIIPKRPVSEIDSETSMSVYEDPQEVYRKSAAPQGSTPESNGPGRIMAPPNFLDPEVNAPGSRKVSFSDEKSEVHPIPSLKDASPTSEDVVFLETIAEDSEANDTDVEKSNRNPAKLEVLSDNETDGLC